VRENVYRFMIEKLGVEKNECRNVWKRAFEKHNQTLKGLRSEGYEIDKEEFWDFIRSGREKFLSEAPEVASLLQALPQSKWVVTNCNERHAWLALKEMKLDQYFEGVLGSDFMEPYAKPQEEAFQAVVERIGIAPSEAVMFEDSVKNLRTCKTMGMRTVLVRGATAREEGASVDDLVREGIVDHVVASCSEGDVRAAAPSLFARG